MGLASFRDLWLGRQASRCSVSSLKEAALLIMAEDLAVGCHYQSQAKAPLALHLWALPRGCSCLEETEVEGVLNMVTAKGSLQGRRRNKHHMTEPFPTEGQERQKGLQEGDTGSGIVINCVRIDLSFQNTCSVMSQQLASSFGVRINVSSPSFLCIKLLLKSTGTEHEQNKIAPII